MKKFIYILFVFLTLIMVAIVAVPYFFKDKIFERIDREIASSVNAQVYYDEENINLSVFKRFPNLSATIGEFGIKGNPPFQNDTLVHVGAFQVDLNLWSVLFDDYPTLTGIHMIDGDIYVKVLEDGQANYDIMFEDENETLAAEPSEFQIGVDMIEVENLSFIYDDRELGFLMALSELDLNGGGNFTMDVYDLLANGGGKIVKVVYDEVEYLTNKWVEIDSRINVDLENMKFGFEDASVKLNEFGFGLEGYLAMPTEDIQFDARFYGEDNSFSSLLSLVPGLYTDSFQNLDTSGEMDFSGFVKGIYNENKIPSFELALAVNDGMFQYPDLPRPVQNVNLNLLVKNESDKIDHTSVDISDFSLQFGDQPLSGNFHLKNLIDLEMEGALKGDLDLYELTSIFPIEDMELRGNLVIDAMAKGKYDSIAQTIPAVNARLALTNGYVKSAAYPSAIEDFKLEASAINHTGRMTDMLIDLPSFGFNLDGEEIRGKLKVQDLEALNYDFSIHGGLDLGKLAEIFSLEEIIMEGQVLADIEAEGSYADVENNRFDQLNTSGEIALNNFFYADKDYPQGIRIHEAISQFSPRNIKLVKMDARLEKARCRPLEVYPIIWLTFLMTKMVFWRVIWTCIPLNLM
jgi:hypothetical protein